VGLGVILNRAALSWVGVFITAEPSTKLFTWGGGGDMGGHVLRETTSRGLCGLGCVGLLFLVVCVCLLLQDLVQSCVRGEGGDIGGHVLRETTSRGLCGLVCPSRTVCCCVCVYYYSTYYKAVRVGGGG
jgi:hypothetical protein